jgi:putative phosphoesterase
MGETSTAPRRIGFLADTHSARADGSDLPDQVLDAFAGVDLIVHLGDIGRKAILDRLSAVAPVWVPGERDKGYVPWQPTIGPDGSATPVKVVEADGTSVGMTFDLSKPDKKIVADEQVDFPDEPLAGLLQRRFERPVDAVAFGGTHRQVEQRHEDVVFFNPGSPNLPVPDTPAGVAVLDLTGGTPRVELITISP